MPHSPQKHVELVRNKRASYSGPRTTQDDGDYTDVRPVIAAMHASAQFGGEAILPLHYFRLLRKRGIEAWLVVHERTRSELSTLLADDVERIHFLPDRLFHRARVHVGQLVSHPLVDLPLDLAMITSAQLDQRRAVRALVQRVGATVVHEPIPVSPRAPSLMSDIGAPVVIGPMNGGMSYPPGFPRFQSRSAGAVIRAARSASAAVHLVMPGKRRATTLLVANERTRRALPAGCAPHVLELVENGVDFTLFAPRARQRPWSALPRFAFVGRLVEWKAVDLLLAAAAKALARAQLELIIIGDGALRAGLEAQSRALGIEGRVTFTGFLTQEECAEQLADADALVLPSLYECGGAVVLEAMAMGLPVIATRWGGPADYLDDETGILVEPRGEEPFVEELAAALVRLADNWELRHRLGSAARMRVQEHFDWERKIDHILDIYRDAQERAGRSRQGPRALRPE